MRVYGINFSYECEKGLMGMINQHSWMFLSSYEKLRETYIRIIMGL